LLSDAVSLKLVFRLIDNPIGKDPAQPFLPLKKIFSLAHQTQYVTICYQ